MKIAANSFRIFIIGIGFMLISIVNRAVNFSISRGINESLEFFMTSVYIFGILLSVIFGMVSAFSSIREILRKHE